MLLPRANNLTARADNVTARANNVTAGANNVTARANNVTARGEEGQWTGSPSPLAMSIRWTSEVPSPISRTFASR
jgi:hypothetical protein